METTRTFVTVGGWWGVECKQRGGGWNVLLGGMTRLSDQLSPKNRPGENVNGGECLGEGGGCLSREAESGRAYIHAYVQWEERESDGEKSAAAFLLVLILLPPPPL